MSEGGWQPIETAPKIDDAYIIGIVGRVGVLPCAWDESEQRWVSWNMVYETQFKKPFEPHHWMPISSLPSSPSLGAR